MAQYIDKAALVAEIERRKKEWSYGGSTEAKYKVEAYNELIEWLDTLEVKEVDLEKENFIKKEIGYIKGYREKAIKMLDELKAQKGEEV